MENIPENSLIGSTNIAGPGFINIFIKPEYLISSIGQIVAEKVHFEKSPRPLKVKIYLYLKKEKYKK